jgi:hypothetical protein
VPHKIPETMTKPGAEELAAKIRRYWADRGHAAEIWIEPLNSGFVVRSALRGALPQNDPR